MTRKEFSTQQIVYMAECDLWVLVSTNTSSELVGWSGKVSSSASQAGRSHGLVHGCFVLSSLNHSPGQANGKLLIARGSQKCFSYFSLSARLFRMAYVCIMAVRLLFALCMCRSRALEAPRSPSKSCRRQNQVLCILIPSSTIHLAAPGPVHRKVA